MPSSARTLKTCAMNWYTGRSGHCALYGWIDPYETDISTFFLVKADTHVLNNYGFFLLLRNTWYSIAIFAVDQILAFFLKGLPFTVTS